MNSSRQNSIYFFTGIVGYALFLVLNSFSLWTLPSLGSVVTDWQSSFNLACSLTNVLGFFIAAATAFRYSGFLERALLKIAIAGYIFGYGLFLVIMTTGTASIEVSIVAGILVGLASTCCFVKWALVLRDGTMKWAQQLILTASFLMPLIHVPFNAGSSTMRAYLIVFAVLPASLILLAITGRNSQRTASSRSALPSNQSFKQLLSRLAVPLACTVVIGSVAPLVTTVAFGVSLDAEVITDLTLIASALAVIALAFRWFIQKKPAPISGVYFIMVPIMAAALLLFLFASTELFAYALFFIGTTAFCLISIIVMIASIDIARESRFSLIIVLGIVAGTLYLSRLLGYMLGNAVVALGLSVQLQFTAATILIMYGFSLVAFLIVRKNRRTKIYDITGGYSEPDTQELTSETQGGDALEMRCQLIAEHYHLSERLFEMLTLLAHGRSVKVIAQTLFISENTVRTHIKKLYQTLDVHTRQELIDLIESDQWDAR